MTDRYTLCSMVIHKISCMQNLPIAILFADKPFLRYLKSYDAPIDNLSYTLPDLPPDHGIYVVDTSDLFYALEGSVGDRRGLSRMCALLQIPDLDRFHNAGNDAHVGLIRRYNLMSGLSVLTVHHACHEVHGIWRPIRLATRSPLAGPTDPRKF